MINYTHYLREKQYYITKDKRIITFCCGVGCTLYITAFRFTTLFPGTNVKGIIYIQKLLEENTT